MEGLISILIFSFGVLGTISFQANMIAQSSQVSYRLGASLQVSSLIGAAEADSANYDCYTFPAVNTAARCAGANAFVAAWAAQVLQMPGAAGTPPTAVLDGSGNLLVTVSWQLPNNDAVNSFVSVARPISS